ncbi:Ribosomal silencing factor RsfS [compost metagenome]
MLVDLGDVVVHIMHPTVRTFYNLEEIWGGKSVKLAKPDGKPAKAVKKKAAKRAKAPRRRAGR